MAKTWSGPVHSNAKRLLIKYLALNGFILIFDWHGLLHDCYQQIFSQCILDLNLDSAFHTKETIGLPDPLWVQGTAAWPL